MQNKNTQKQKVYNCDSYNIKQGDKFFFDANIWIKLLSPKANEIARKIQNFFKRINDKKCSIYICPELVSEIFNRLVRNKMDSSVVASRGYKDFRKSKMCREWIQDFSDQFSQLLNNRNVVFINLEIDGSEMLKYFQTKANLLDFKDFIYESLCKSNDLILVTNDYDFVNSVHSINKILSFDYRLYNKP